MPVERPLWVRIGLWGVPNRPSAWVFFWVCMALAMGFMGFGFADPLYAWGGLFIFGSIGYFSVIRWMDKHKQW
jgi:hypothetical protein